MTASQLAESVATAGPPKISRGRTVGVVSILTVVVAALGYFREATLAAQFGLSRTMDAYFAAILVPTTAYMVLIAGTLSPVFISILLQDSISQNPEKLSETFSVVTNFVLIILGGIAGCAIITAHKWLVLLFPGFDSTTVAMTKSLIEIIFPSVIFVALAGILTAVLNGFNRFALASITPALSSVTVIVAALIAHGSHAIYIVGLGTAIGFVLQGMLLVPATAALGIRYRFLFRFRHPAIASVVRLGGPLFLYLVVANGAVFLERNLASQISQGAVSTLTYSMRLFAIPANFLAAPLAIVSYPHFAREATQEGHGDLCNQVSRLFRLVLFLFLPITVWTVLNVLPITRLLYERGQFQLGDSIVTSRTLMFYSVGILPNALGIVLLRCLYAVQDTVTPLVAESINLVFYALTAIFLTRQFGIEGLAFTRGLSFFLVATILGLVVWRKKHLLIMDASLFLFVLRTVAATAIMGLASWLCLHFWHSSFDSGKMLTRAAILIGMLIVSGIVFLGIARMLGLEESTQIVDAVWAMCVPSRFLLQKETAN